MDDLTGPVRHRAENMPLLTYVRSVRKFTASVVHVTPYEAAYVIKRYNEHNRSIRPVDVRADARNMRAGQWPLNGETVKFSRSDDGIQMIDGQHRFTALSIVPEMPDVHPETGKRLPPLAPDFALPFLVVAGLEPEMQDTVDIGIKRTHSDILGLHGFVSSGLLGAVARKVWMWERHDYHFSNNVRFTVPEMLEFVDSHPNMIRSVEVANRVRQVFRQIPPSVVGVAHYVFTQIDPETAPWFFQRLADGADLHKNHPILSLRESLRSVARERAARRYQDEDMAMLIRAWNAVRKGQDLSRIYGLRADGGMPMPE